jgi:hypothetical protein
LGLCSLADVKAQLNITDTTFDTELQAYIDGVTIAIERITGPIEQRSVTERHWDGPALALRRRPVISLTSITAVATAGTVVNTTDVTTDLATGIVVNKDLTNFTGGPWDVVYLAGYAVVPPNVNLAARITIQHMWETQRGMGNAAADQEEVAYIYVAKESLPRRAIELLKPKTPGMA